MNDMRDDFSEAYRQENYFGARVSHLLDRYGETFPPGCRILDVGIGQGRNAFPLARAGQQVTGIDPSETAIRQVQEAVKSEGLSLRAVQVRFQDFDPPEPFDVVLCFGLLQMLPPSQAASLVERLRCWTASGGVLFFMAWHVDDPGFITCCEDWERTGLRSFRSHDREQFRTYLGRKEVLQFFRGWKVVHHWEGLGPAHRHGEEHEHRHGNVELVAVKP
jgi:tellurite methyltransferase